MTAPTGFLWNPYTTARSILANGDLFQAWVGADDADDALNYIQLFESQANLTGNTKYAAVIPEGSAARLTRVSTATGLAGFDWARDVGVGFLEQVTAYSEENATVFLNNAGAILNEYLEHASSIQTMDVASVPWDKAPLRWPEGPLKGYQIFFVISQST